MIKNFVLLGLLTWVSLSYAKHPHHEVIAQETLSEAESYKVETATPEHEIKRGLAGSKIKKKKTEVKGVSPEAAPSESDSEVRYWQYSE